MIGLSDVPREWLDCRKTLETATGSPVYLAGGALRDLDNGAEVKDLDFWVYAENLEQARHAVRFALGKEPTNRCYLEYTTFAEARGIQAIDTYEVYYGEVQVIFLTEPLSLHQLLQGFDFGLCQIGVDGFDIAYTESYLKDRLTQTITITRPDNDERLAKRIARLQDKYPAHIIKGGLHDVRPFI